MLADLRVLDLSTGLGLMCGQLLADMGADVQQWVRPGDAASLEKDLHWRAYTLGKGIHILEWPSERARLESQLALADVVIDCESEEFWEQMGLPAAELARRYPRLIRASISGFGRTGPKSGYQTTDLIAMAASGYLYLSGAAEGVPVRISVPQAHAHASADAAVGILIALFERSSSGLGQLIDVAAQQSATLGLLSRGLDAAVGQEKALRSAYGAKIGGVYLRNLFAARDGWVVVLQGILPPLAGFMERLMSWVCEAGYCDAEVLKQDWGQVAAGMATGELTEQDWEPVQQGIAQLIAAHSKSELMSEAVARRLLVAPAMSMDDVLDSEQLSAREFLVESQRLGHKRLGAFAKLSRTPLPLTENLPRNWTTPTEFEMPFMEEAAQETQLPLAGLKILDVFWVVAGPGATRMLADYGATVIHVESTQRIDMVRNVPPYIGGVAEPERAACHHNTNANKLNITLDLSQPEGKRVLQDLIAWADVFTESFAPGVIDRMGFGYAASKDINPNIIMISSSLMGQSGPWSPYAGYGNSAAAVTGFHALTGFADQIPTGCYGPYTDFTSVRFNALAILGAVLEQRRTGMGQYIDMAQSEAALHFLAPACLSYLGQGQVMATTGNRDVEHAPHGVFPALGDDRWVALVIRDDEEWRTFCAIVELDSFAELQVEGRHQRADEIEGAICEWTVQRDAEEIEQFLQARGIAAHSVSDTHALFTDTQLNFREHFLPVSHRDFEGAHVESSRLRFSRTQPRRPEHAPWFGVDTERVLRDVLSYPEDQIHALQEGAILR